MSTVIGVFDDRSQAENSMNEIRNAGITEDEISVIAKEGIVRGDEDENNGITGGISRGATTGGTIGGLAGLIAGAGALTIPGIGPIVAAGPIAAGLTGVAAGGITGSLVDMGIPEDRGEYYENEVKKGSIIATVEADRAKVNEVASFMRKNQARDVEIH